MTCAQCEGPLTGDPPAVIHDRVEHRFCSVRCMTDWVINLDFVEPIKVGTNRLYWRVLDFTETPPVATGGNQP